MIRYVKLLSFLHFFVYYTKLSIKNRSGLIFIIGAHYEVGLTLKMYLQKLF